MFKIETNNFGNFTRIMLIDAETKAHASIIPEFGGNVNEILLSKNGRKYSIIDGARSYSELIENRMFKGAKLLPFPNRVNNGQYCFEGKFYQLPLNFGRHAIHGFVYNKRLTVKKQSITNTEAWVELEYLYDATIEGYAFKFKAVMLYYLMKDKGFKYTTVIANIGTSPIPVGDGWHPYFKTGGKVDRFMIKIPSNRRIEVGPQMIPTGELIPEDYSHLSTIGERDFDTGFSLEEKEGQALTEVYDPELDLKINIWQETGKWKYNYLQVFIPPSRKSIAIEPMTCAADAFNNKMGLIVLKPKQSFSASCGVFLS